MVTGVGSGGEEALVLLSLIQSHRRSLVVEKSEKKPNEGEELSVNFDEDRHETKNL
jgi:hypothetical protein